MKTNTNVSIKNQLIFVRIIFLLKINTKFPIEFTVHFELLFDDRKALFCVENQYKYFNWKSVCFGPLHFSTENQYDYHRQDCLYWKSMKMCLLKINWFASFKKTLGFPFTFNIGIFKYIFLSILLYFWNCHFVLKTNNNFSIEIR